jgi:type IV pilus assembly protein PilW
MMTRLMKMSKNSGVRDWKTPVRNKVLGVSLIELMIAIALGVVVMLAVTTVFVNTSATRAEIERSSRQIENGRYVMEVLSNELQLAGFLGELGVSATLLPTPSQTAFDAANSICTGIAPGDPVQTMLPIHVQGVNNVATGTKPSCITGLTSADNDILEGTDILAVRRASTCVDADAGCLAAAGFYIQSALCKNDIVPFVVANAIGSNFTLKKNDCVNPAPIRQIYTHIYYIAKNNKAGDGVPTLKRLVLSNGVVAVDPIAEGVDNLQVLYGVDTNNDGAPDSYTAAPALVTDWRNVTTVKLGVLTRNLEKTVGHQQSKFYDLAGTVVGPFIDDVKRHAYSETVRLSNVAGRRE